MDNIISQVAIPPSLVKNITETRGRVLIELKCGGFIQYTPSDYNEKINLRDFVDEVMSNIINEEKTNQRNNV